MLTVWNAFNDLFNDELAQRPPVRQFLPAVDISEDEKAFTISADIPGMRPEDVDVSIENNVLTVKGERKDERQENKKGYHRVERRYGAFKRSFTLPEGVNPEMISANVEHGTLTLTVPKPVAALPRKVKINLGETAKANAA